MKIKMLMPVMAFVGMLCVGCGSDENEKEKELPFWSSKGWQSAKYAMIENHDRHFIEVPAEGGTYTFTRTDAKELYISSIAFEPYDDAYATYGYRADESELEKHKYSFSNKWCEVTVKDNVVQFRFLANNGYERQALVSIKVADDFEPFCFLQKCAYPSVAGNSVVGDWIFDYTPYANGFDLNQICTSRLSLKDDATYVYTYDLFIRLSSGYFFVDEFGNMPGTRLSEEVGCWRDSADYIVLEPLYPGGKKYCKVAMGKLCPILDYGDYKRMEGTAESVVPYYQLEAVPSKSASYKYMKPGESYTLNVKLYTKGVNYKMEKVYLEISQGSKGTYTLDLSEYRMANGDYSIPMNAPAAGNVSLVLHYEGSYTGDPDLRNDCEYFHKVRYLDFMIK